MKLGDDRGMSQAIGLETRSMEPGSKPGTTVKHSTARKARSAYTNVWEASPWSGGDISLASHKQTYHATRNPGKGTWYETFSRGFKIRIGQVTRQDKAFTIPLIHKLCERYEEKWIQADGRLALSTLFEIMFILLTFCGGMRGYEAVWTDLGGLRYDLEYIETTEDESGVGWPIVGRFKAEGGGTRCHVIPIAGLTKSGIPFLKWTRRFVRRLEEEGRFSKWAFAREDGRRAAANDFKVGIFEELEWIQSRHPELIDPKVNIWEDYGVQRSGRRGFTNEARNLGVSRDDIEAQCRWETDRNTGGKGVNRSMFDTYSDFRNMKKTLLRPSQAL